MIFPCPKSSEILQMSSVAHALLYPLLPGIGRRMLSKISETKNVNKMEQAAINPNG